MEKLEPLYTVGENEKQRSFCAVFTNASYIMTHRDQQMFNDTGGNICNQPDLRLGRTGFLLDLLIRVL